MKPESKVTVIVDNETGASGLRAEHGWSAWIEHQGHHVLLDTGQGQALAPNAEALSLPWERLEAVVLSHGHYDHTGGLPHALEAGNRPAVFAHPAAWQKKYALEAGGPAREIGTSTAILELVRTRAKKVEDILRPTEVIPGLWLTGPIPRRTDFEDVGGSYYLDAHGGQADTLPDDQAMFFEAREGLVVLLGCAHAGVINTLRYIQKLRPGRKYHVVLGGMHLLRASEERLERTLEGLEMLEVTHVYPAHCTGQPARERLGKRFGSWCTNTEAGQVYTFALPEGVK